jgi:hypothetical protein
VFHPTPWFRTIAGRMTAGGAALSLLCLLLVSASVVVAGDDQPAYVGFRYDNTGMFPADARPPADFDGPSGKNLLWKVPPEFWGGPWRQSQVSKDNIARRRLSEFDGTMDAALSLGQDPWKAAARELYTLAADLQDSLGLPP